MGTSLTAVTWTVSRRTSRWPKTSTFTAGCGRVTTPIDALLAELELAHATQTRVRHLSAGQRRRTALATLQLSGAKLWVLDEPMTNLDGAGRTLVVDWTRRHLGGGGIAVVATHQPEEFMAPGTFVIEL